MGAWSRFGRRGLTAVLRELDELCAVTPQDSRQVTVIGPKGGSAKTSTVAAVLHLLSERVVGMLVGIDCNADRGTLTQRLGLPESQVPSRLLALAQDPSTVQYLMDLSGYLDRVGRVHLLHNDGVPSLDVDGITREQYTAVLRLLSRYAEITIVDTGTSMVHPSTLAALDHADHVVIAAAADPPALQVTAEGVAELVNLGYGPLISRSTMVATVTDASVRPDTYAQGADFFAARCGNIQVVPYDRWAGAVGAIRWGSLRPPTKLAFARVTGHIMRSLVPASEEASDRNRDVVGKIHRESLVSRWAPLVREPIKGVGAPFRPPDIQTAEEGHMVGAAGPAGVDPETQLPDWAFNGRDTEIR